MKNTLLPAVDEETRQALNVDAHSARIAQYLSLFILIPLMWEASVWWNDTPAAVLPAPSTIVSAFLQEPNHYLASARLTVTVVLAAFVIATVTGFIAGVCIYYIRFVREYVYPLLTAVTVVPKVAFAPAIIIWLGLGMSSALALALLIAFFPIMVNTYTGLQSVDEDYVDMVRSYNDSRLFIFRTIRLPAAAPQLASGLKLSMIYSIVGVVVAEFLGATDGLGQLIIAASRYARTVEMFTGVVIVAVISVVLYYSTAFVTSKVIYWES